MFASEHRFEVDIRKTPENEQHPLVVGVARQGVQFPAFRDGNGNTNFSAKRQQGFPSPVFARVMQPDGVFRVGLQEFENGIHPINPYGIAVFAGRLSFHTISVQPGGDVEGTCVKKGRNLAAALDR